MPYTRAACTECLQLKLNRRWSGEEEERTKTDRRSFFVKKNLTLYLNGILVPLRERQNGIEAIPQINGWLMTVQKNYQNSTTARTVIIQKLHGWLAASDVFNLAPYKRQRR